ncbi:uncharacterized protein SOCE26_103660 [Sorangium cellulosum]|uniref:Large catalase C-terminal domain-containing protein n=1 Tax=Sorangium cellulosum TaxID=56 RepID=A0A2L0FB51_SORCE|nr:hypothetical protein [Sorangium cellulosum]AUX48825.1 uncharacterized protein SOCE26_103660 [Sorangium cellulosum]
MEGVDTALTFQASGAAAGALYEALLLAGAVPRYVGARLGVVRTAEGDELPVEVTIEAAPSVLFDAAALPPGAGAAALARDGLAVEFVQLQYRHCKPLLVPASAAALALPFGSPRGHRLIQRHLETCSGASSPMAAHPRSQAETPNRSARRRTRSSS